MDIKTKYSRRKKRSNHNFFIISVGFILVLLVLIFGAQDMMYQAGQKKDDRVLHCEIENKSAATLGKLTVGDVVLFEDSLPQGKTSFEYHWRFDSTKTVVFNLKDTTLNFENICVTDSVAYLMVEVKPTTTSALAITNSFFE